MWSKGKLNLTEVAALDVRVVQYEIVWNSCSRKIVVSDAFMVMSEEQVPVSVVRGIIIHFLVKEGIKSSEIYRRHKQQFDSEYISDINVFDWCASFHNSLEKVENEPH